MKCEKCGCKTVKEHYCSDGELSYTVCDNCGDSVAYYHITARGKEILSTLLTQSSSTLGKENSSSVKRVKSEDEQIRIR